MRQILEDVGHILEYCLIAVVMVLIGLGAGYFFRKNIAEGKLNQAEQEAARIIANGERTAESKKKEALLEAKEEIHKLRSDVERENKDRRSELQRMERRILQKEESLDKKLDNIEHKEEALHRKEADLAQSREKIEALYEKQMAELERISGMTFEEAKNILLTNVEQEIRHETAIMVKEMEQQAKDDAEKKAKEIISSAIQRCAADHVAETTVSVVALPNDEMKGRIIGREGRNIRALETLTGIDLIIDDTPEAVILSGFDPIRREVARIALEKLIVDGRIHPARIEEMVGKARKEVDQTIKEAGEQATFEADVHGLHPEIVKILGRLKYRTSYGQNVLKHSIEVSHLAGLMAAELGCDVTLAKRGGLIHDIGKALDRELEGSHVQIGVDVARKYRESAAVINCIGAHHGDEEFQSVEAVLVAAADAISAARPGARRETLENYLKRLSKLEEIAESFEGVEKCFAIQAGREIRVIVNPEEVDDTKTYKIAKEVKNKIEETMQYPGNIKVNVIREVRAVKLAR